MVVPWLLERGGVLFDTVIENRPPGLAAIIAAVQAASPLDAVLTLRALNLLLVCAVTLLTFAIGAKLLNSLAGLLAATAWFLLEPVYGNILFYFDGVLGAFFLLAVAIWWRFEGRRPAWLAPLGVGILLGSSILIKQHAVAVAVLFGVWLLLFSSRRVSNLLFYMLGVSVFPVLLLIIVSAQGNLDSYLLWNWSMNFSSVHPGSSISGDFLRKYMLTIALIPVFAALTPRFLTGRKASLIAFVWLGATATMIPNFGEIYVMAQLPLVAIMSGSAVALMLREGYTASATIGRQVIMGFSVLLASTWALMLLAAYLPHPIGTAKIPAYDEFRPVAEMLDELAEANDTLFVLPELDGNAQLHVLTNMVPPGMWMNGHAWFFALPSATDRLMNEWEVDPPSFIVYFPELIEQSMPFISPFVDFMEAHYEAVGQVEDVPFNGDAVIFRLRQG